MKILIILSIIGVFTITSRNDLVTKEGNTWMSENLSVSSFRNGDTIFHAKTSEQWKIAFKNKIPAFCYYNNDSIENEKLGKLYNFHAVRDDRGLAPEGWHIATDKEWESLILEFGGKKKAGKILMNNEFNLICGGIRDVDCEFHNLGASSLFWTATLDFNFFSYNRQIWTDNITSTSRGSSHHAMGLYVRCVKNK